MLHSHVCCLSLLHRWIEVLLCSNLLLNRGFWLHQESKTPEYYTTTYASAPYYGYICSTPCVTNCSPDRATDSQSCVNMPFLHLDLDHSTFLHYWLIIYKWKSMFKFSSVNFAVVLLLGVLSLLAGRPPVYRTPPRLGEKYTCCSVIKWVQ
jgi:hypothetical protein